jgi:polyphenol oxidase
MKQIERNGIVYYQFEILSEFPELVHGIFTRVGGVSPAPYHSLNVGAGVGDSRENVSENRRRVARTLGFDDSVVLQTWQKHGSDVVVVQQYKKQNHDNPPDGDGLITSITNMPLQMRFADCVPFLFYEPKKHVIGIAHAGWRGTLKRTACATVTRMCEEYKCYPEDIIVGIGPSIGSDHYEVGDEVIDAMTKEFGQQIDGLVYPPLHGQNNKRLDLSLANERALRKLGVKHIEQSLINTAAKTHEFYSERVEKQTGQFAAMIALRPPMSLLSYVRGVVGRFWVPKLP